MTKTDNPRRGSTLDSFLDEEGVLAEFRAKAIEEAVAGRRAKPERKIPRFPKDG
jgi:antitoxin HicB